jgi:lipopolysaccharide/colanic/teichoic acid biosynthesis glycosyltransferase
MKRMFDLMLSLSALCCLLPVLLLIGIAVWLEDGGSPWYRGIRVGRGGVPFRMLKFRSMRVDAWRTGVNSTADGDGRITRVGRRLRRWKLDELPQLWNVLLGEMSFVGPRPQVPADAGLYTHAERRMLCMRPGITDLASIVFSDEGRILEGSGNPDLLYNQIIRPWKSRMALLYVGHASLVVDVKILALTAFSLVSRRGALNRVASLLSAWSADPLVCRVALRVEDLLPYPPPGANDIVGQYPQPTLEPPPGIAIPV